MKGELFKGIKQWEFDWAGEPFKLPVFYYDNTSLTAIFTASTRKVRALLPHPGMHPIEMSSGRCMAAFTAFEYRETDIGPYNEFSIAFLVTFEKPQVPGLTALWQMVRRRFTAHVWKLPVTTEIARAGGVELYGYPKFLAEITFERTPGQIRCDLSEKGEKILALEGNVLPAKKGGLSRYVTCSVLDGIPLVANVVVNPLEFAQTRDKAAAGLNLGTGHAISETLREIRLSPDPVMYQFSPVNEAILFAGRNLLDK